ncbi:predicted protein, partial [Paramuricea clavata]
MTENSINLNSSVDDVVDFLEEAGLGELKAKFQECEVDGNTFINMDLVDLNALTPKLKLRRILRNKWTEITGMKFSAEGEKLPQPGKLSDSLSLGPALAFGTPECSRPAQSGSRSGLHDTPLVAPSLTPSACNEEGESSPSTNTDAHIGSSIKRKSSVDGRCVSSSKKRVCLFDSKNKDVEHTRSSNGEYTYWLEKFEIPSKWEPMVQAALDNGELTVENKNALNRQLCTSLYACTDKVTKSERDHVAMRLVKKYPCLKSPVGAGH